MQEKLEKISLQLQNLIWNWSTRFHCAFLLYHGPMEPKLVSSLKTISGTIFWSIYWIMLWKISRKIFMTISETIFGKNFEDSFGDNFKGNFEVNFVSNVCFISSFAFRFSSVLAMKSPKSAVIFRQRQYNWFFCFWSFWPKYEKRKMECGNDRCIFFFNLNSNCPNLLDLRNL